MTTATPPAGPPPSTPVRLARRDRTIGATRTPGPVHRMTDRTHLPRTACGRSMRYIGAHTWHGTPAEVTCRDCRTLP